MPWKETPSKGPLQAGRLSIAFGRARTCISQVRLSAKRDRRWRRAEHADAGQLSDHLRACGAARVPLHISGQPAESCKSSGCSHDCCRGATGAVLAAREAMSPWGAPGTRCRPCHSVGAATRAGSVSRMTGTHLAPPCAAAWDEHATIAPMIRSEPGTALTSRPASAQM